MKTIVSIFVLTFLLSAFNFTVSAQKEDEDFQAVVMKVQELTDRTAVLENGKLKSARLPIPGEGEKLFQFEWAADGRSFTLVSETNERISISLNVSNEMQTITLPGNEQAVVSWKTLEGMRVVDDVVIGTGPGSMSLFDDSLLIANGGCGAAIHAARDAIIAPAITCSVSPGRGCWAAVGYAAYMVYRMRRACL